MSTTDQLIWWLGDWAGAIAGPIVEVEEWAFQRRQAARWWLVALWWLLVQLPPHILASPGLWVAEQVMERQRRVEPGFDCFLRDVHRAIVRDETRKKAYLQ